MDWISHYCNFGYPGSSDSLKYHKHLKFSASNSSCFDYASPKLAYKICSQPLLFWNKKQLSKRFMEQTPKGMKSAVIGMKIPTIIVDSLCVQEDIDVSFLKLYVFIETMSWVYGISTVLFSLILVQWNGGLKEIGEYGLCRHKICSPSILLEYYLLDMKYHFKLLG